MISKHCDVLFFFNKQAWRSAPHRKDLTSLFAPVDLHDKGSNQVAATEVEVKASQAVKLNT